MMELTEADVDFLIQVMTDRYLQIKGGSEVAERLEELKKLWNKIEGLPIGEVDIYLLGEVPGRKQLTQVHSFAVGDKYKLLPEDEPVSTYYNYNLGDDIDGVDWKIQDIRAHAVEHK